MRRFSLNPRRPAEPPQCIRAALWLIVLFAALSFASIAMITAQGALHLVEFAMFLPANAVLVVAMLVLPWRLCLPTLLACFAIEVLFALHTTYAVQTNFVVPAQIYTLSDSLFFSGMDLGTSYLVAVLTRWLCGARTDLSRLRRLTTFAGIGIVAPGIGATLGEAWFNDEPIAMLIYHGWHWALSNALGYLLATPAILLAFKATSGPDAYVASGAERGLLVLLTVLLTVIAFVCPEKPLFPLISPMLVLIAFRAGPTWMFVTVLITAILSCGLTMHGLGPFTRLAQGNVFRAEDLLQGYILAIFLTAVPAGSAIGEKARKARRLSNLKALREHSATHDGLTGLANRAHFQQRLRHALSAGKPCTVVFIDLDGFKQVNDLMGHAAGDQVLGLFATRLRALVAQVIQNDG